MSKKQTSLEDQLYIIGLCLLLAAPLIVIAYHYLRARLTFLMMPCLLRTFTGYYCPVYLWFMISHTIEKLSRYRLRIGMKWNSAWLWIALVILALNVLVKDGALLLFRIDLLQMIP